MKKFTQNDDKIKKYAGNQVLKNKINDIIEETLLLKVDGKINKDAIIIGKEKLVESINKLISLRVVEAQSDELNSFKKILFVEKQEVPEILVEKRINFSAFDKNGLGKVVDQYFDTSWIYIVEKDGINYPIKEEQIVKIYETGEWDEDEMGGWKEELTTTVEQISEETNGKLQLIDVKGFDAYQGPYAIVDIDGKNYKIWTTEYPNVLYIDNFILTNTKDDTGYEGTVEMIIQIINDLDTYKETGDLGLINLKK